LRPDIRHASADATLTKREEITRSKPANRLKAVSARLLRKEHDAHVRRYLWGGHLWSDSYFAGSCGGAPLTVVRQCIENQQRPA